MTRRTYISMLAAALIMMVTAIAGTSRAQAQNPNCCSYTVDASGAYPAACLQFKVLIRWGTGPSAGNSSVGVTGNGTFVYAVPFPCPPTLSFVWVSFNGGFTTYPLGYNGPVTINGCNRTLSVQLDGNGCIKIVVT